MSMICGGELAQTLLLVVVVPVSMICGGELAQTLVLVVVVLSVYDLWRRTGSNFVVSSGGAQCL